MVHLNHMNLCVQVENSVEKQVLNVEKILMRVFCIGLFLVIIFNNNVQKYKVKQEMMNKKQSIQNI